MISKICDFSFKKKFFILVYAFIAIHGKYTVIDPSFNLLVSESEMSYIDKIAREDKVF